MRRLLNVVLFMAVLALIAIAALSGVWMKKPDKDKAAKVPSITVVVPPPTAHDPLAPPPAIPDAKQYPV